MSKHNDRKHSGRKGVMGTFLALLLIGALAVAVPIIMQDMELNRDAVEYEELRKALATAAPVPTSDEPKQVDPAVNVGIPDETETPDSETEESGDEPEPLAEAAEPQATENPAAEESAAPSQVLEERTVPDMAALKAQNDDFAAWIQIPGTNVDYPVVVSDDTEYYLTHKNVLIIGGSGSGKTRFWLKPNLMQCHSSYVVTDPKGSIVVECGRLLQKKGYRIKILNTINFGKSMHYNPFAYIHSEKDILKLVTTLIANTKGEGKAGDDFWVSATRSHTNAAPCAISSTD